MKKTFSYVLAALIGGLVAIQFAPVDKRNPRISQEIKWDSVETEALVRRACYDCHSNETRWPWYASVAPMSWRVTAHVVDARRHLNFSAWDVPNEDLDEVVEMIETGEMPLWDYLLVHWDARLADDDETRLLDGLRRTFASDPPIERRGRGSATVDTVAAESTPGEAGPDEGEAGDAVPDEVAPGEGAAGDTAPGDVPSTDSTSAEPVGMATEGPSAPESEASRPAADSAGVKSADGAPAAKSS